MTITQARSRWKTKPLREVAAIERQTIAADHIPSGTKYVGLEHITNSGSFVGVREVSNGELASTKFQFTSQHILYGKLRPYLSKIARPDFEGVCSTDILPILPGKEVDRGFLYYFLRQPHMVQLATSRSIGANLPRLSPRQLAEFQIPLPPLAEQKRIADILDKADAIRRKRQEAIGAAESLLGSAFQGMFGDPVSNLAGYKTVTLGDADIRISDGNYSSKYPKASDFIKTGIPFIRANNLKQRTVIDKDMRFISEAQHAELRKGHLKANDVLIVTRGNIGEVALVPPKYENANINAQLVLLRPTSKQFTPEFLLGFFSAPSVRGQVLRLQTGTALKQLPVGQLVQLTLPIASEEKQNQFATLFQKQQETLASLTSHREESDDLFSSLVQRAFRGEL